MSEIKVGDTYNGVKVIEDLGRNTSYGHRHYLCICPICGNTFEIEAARIGITKTCRLCVHQRNVKDIRGERYGRLVVVRYLGRKNKQSIWECKCDCGEIISVTSSHLRQGNTKSCGCFKKEVGLSGGSLRKSASIELGVVHKHPLYNIWRSMKARCYKPYSSRYSHYGGRGIKVCERWLGDCGFEHFIEDMGCRPSTRHTIDRINLDGDYSPKNCRWATYTEQNRNRTNTLFVVFDNKKFSVPEICEKFKLSYRKVYQQLRRGQDIETIIKNNNRL